MKQFCTGRQTDETICQIILFVFILLNSRKFGLLQKVLCSYRMPSNNCICTETAALHSGASLGKTVIIHF